MALSRAQFRLLFTFVITRQAQLEKWGLVAPRRTVVQVGEWRQRLSFQIN